MSPISRSGARQLTTTARELGAEALGGQLTQNDAGRWTVSYVEIESWLSRFQGREIVLIAAAIDEKPIEYTRICRTCGNEYQGRTCPHCEAVRRRLRG